LIIIVCQTCKFILSEYAISLVDMLRSTKIKAEKSLENDSGTGKRVQNTFNALELGWRNFKV
jgi:hypothetical protein